MSHLLSKLGYAFYCWNLCPKAWKHPNDSTLLLAAFFQSFSLPDPRGARDTRSLGVQILSFSCSFLQKIGYYTHFVSWRPVKKIVDPPLLFAPLYHILGVKEHGGIFMRGRGQQIDFSPLDV